MQTGLIYDDVFLKHNTGKDHPESAKRLSYTINHLYQQSWFPTLRCYQATRADISSIALIHNKQYISRFQQACKTDQVYFDSTDVSICNDSFDIALYAVGSVLSIADKIMSGDIKNGFALIRPPGHHAEMDKAHGFCMFNNVAILARTLQQTHQIHKILILDWDVHHGNGTQHAFEEDPSVLYISIHQYPAYPGTGAAHETGIGRGKGSTLNCPMKAGTGDAEYKDIFINTILPKIDAFKPEFIIISAGFDAHSHDPLGHINLSTDVYSWMSQRILEKAEQHCQGRLLSVLEGGYHLTALAHCISNHLAILSTNQDWQYYP